MCVADAPAVRPSHPDQHAQDCTACGAIVRPYRHTASTSFVTMPCGRCVGGQRDDVCDKSREKCVARGYNLVDKSAWTAHESRDYVYVGGHEAEIAGAYAVQGGRRDLEGTNVPERYGFPLVFACQTEATGWYASQVQDGIIGFSTARTRCERCRAEPTVAPPRVSLAPPRPRSPHAVCFSRPDLAPAPPPDATTTASSTRCSSRTSSSTRASPCASSRRSSWGTTCAPRAS